MDSGIAVLRDIHDLDPAPWLPLAPGWWALLALAALLLLTFGIRFWLRNSGMLTGWRGDARRQLRALQRALRNEQPREIAGRLAILLRRIAMARSGRRGTASLTGDSWLDWLEQNDSSGFKWTSRAQLLVKAPYMPPSWPVERKEVTRLIAAASRWIRTVTPADRRKSRRRRDKTVALGRRSHV